MLDARLRVRGVSGLRVVDAGAMPTITSGNTSSPTLMMAEMAANWVRADARSSRHAAGAPHMSGELFKTMAGIARYGWFATHGGSGSVAVTNVGTLRTYQ